MKALSFAAIFVPFLPILAACSSGDLFVGSDQSASKGDPSIDGGNCVTDTDCPSGDSCGFNDADQCSAVGRCFASPGAVCEAYSAGCACDGTEINVACTPFPSGYTSKPLLHTGACTGGAADAGGGSCTTDKDCSSTEACGFLQSEACAAHGTCVAKNVGPTCALYAPGCACDGTEIGIACTELPTGYVGKPLAHAGACSTEIDGGSGAADAGR